MELAERMRRFRGTAYDTFNATYDRLGANLRYNDILASTPVQLASAAKIVAHRRLHAAYRAGLADLPFVRLLDVDEPPGTSRCGPRR